MSPLRTLLALLLLSSTCGFQIQRAVMPQAVRTAATPLTLRMMCTDEAPPPDPIAAETETPAPPPAAPAEPAVPESVIFGIPGPLIVLGGAAVLGFMPFLKQGIIPSGGYGPS